MAVLQALFETLRASVRSRAALQLEMLALRHQLHVLERSRPQRVRTTRADRVLWVWLSRIWREWTAAVVIVKPETVIAWHRRGFRLFWRWKSQLRGRPTITADLRALIRSMSHANPLWGAPRLHGELLKLGIEVSEATVAPARNNRNAGRWTTGRNSRRIELTHPTGTCVRVNDAERTR